MDQIKPRIINFFKDNPTPSDKDVHALSNELKINTNEFESIIYSMLGEALSKTVGKHNDWDDSKFDPKELKLGIKIEGEHSDDLEVMKNIAKDHLAECGTYYSRLVKMEADCERDENKSKKSLEERVNIYLNEI